MVGLGDRATKGVAHFCHDGMIKRSITSALIDSPTMIPMVLQDKIESYTLPQGVLSQITRDIAGGRPGLITKVGLHTFMDPRQLGGRQSPSAKEDLIELMTIDGEEWLRYKPFRIDVALLRGTTADEDGNVTMEHEALFGEMLSTAQACRRQGGIVIVEVKRLAKRNTLPPKNVKIPGILVDYIVVDPEQRQTYATEYSPSYAGELRVPLQHLKALPFSERKIVARRAAMEIVPGAICNLGAGISTGISAVAAEENILDDMILTNEQGFIGGAPLTGVDSGTAQNYAGPGRRALPVRLLRRRRPRHRIPVLCRGRSQGQRQYQPVRRQDRRRRRLHQHQPERQEDGVQRHLHGRRTRRPHSRTAGCASCRKASTASSSARSSRSATMPPLPPNRDAPPCS